MGGRGIGGRGIGGRGIGTRPPQPETWTSNGLCATRGAPAMKKAAATTTVRVRFIESSRTPARPLREQP